MDEAAVRLQLQEVMRDVFSDDAIEIFDEMTAADVTGWDSLNHINLVIAVERRFSVRLTTKDVAALKNVGGMLALLRAKLA
jgi:acyl carrier protein